MIAIIIERTNNGLGNMFGDHALAEDAEWRGQAKGKRKESTPGRGKGQGELPKQEGTEEAVKEEGGSEVAGAGDAEKVATSQFIPLFV